MRQQQKIDEENNNNHNKETETDNDFIHIHIYKNLMALCHRYGLSTSYSHDCVCVCIHDNGQIFYMHLYISTFVLPSYFVGRVRVQFGATRENEKINYTCFKCQYTICIYKYKTGR